MTLMIWYLYLREEGIGLMKVNAVFLGKSLSNKSHLISLYYTIR